MLPTTLPLGQPLECTFCSEDLWCNHETGYDDPGFNSLFVRKHCHQNMTGAVLYYPFIILGIAAALVIVDRPFVSFLFQSQDIDNLYTVLVKDSGINIKKRQVKVEYYKYFSIMQQIHILATQHEELAADINQRLP